MSILKPSAITRIKRVLEYNKALIDKKGDLQTLVPDVSEIFTVIDDTIVISIDDDAFSKQNEVSTLLAAIMTELLHFINLNELFLTESPGRGIDLKTLEILSMLYEKTAASYSDEIAALCIELPSLDFFLKKIYEFQQKDTDTQLRKRHAEMQDTVLQDMISKLKQHKERLNTEYAAKSAEYTEKIAELEQREKHLRSTIENQQAEGSKVLEATKTDYETARHEIDRLSCEIKDLRGRNARLQEDHSKEPELQRRIDELASQLLTQQQTEQSLRERYEQDNTALHENVKEKEKRVADLEAEKKEIRNEFSRTQKELKDKLKRNVEQSESLESQVESLKELNKTLIQDKDALQQPLKASLAGGEKGEFQLIAVDLNNICASQIDRRRGINNFDIEQMFAKIHAVLHAQFKTVNLFKIMGLIFFPKHLEKYQYMIAKSTNAKLLAFASMFKWVPARFTKTKELGRKVDQDTDVYVAAHIATKIATYRDRIGHFYLASGDKDCVVLHDTIQELGLDIPIHIITVEGNLSPELRKVASTIDYF